MELTIYRTSVGSLVITEACLIDVQHRSAQSGLSKALRVLLGFAAGGEVGAAFMYVEGEEEGILGGGGSILNLGDAQGVPEFHRIDRVLTCWGSEVPEDLATHPDWFRRLDDEAKLTFFPRTRIRSLQLHWSGSLRGDVDGRVDLDVGLHFWQVPGVRRRLKRAEYPLE